MISIVDSRDTIFISLKELTESGNCTTEHGKRNTAYSIQSVNNIVVKFSKNTDSKRIEQTQITLKSIAKNQCILQ